MKSRFEIITHANGESTIRDRELGQEMHSRVGPWIEAMTVYADASQIDRRLSPERAITLHDVGMGTGSNVFAALTKIKEACAQNTIPDGCTLRIHSFEAHPEGARYALDHPDTFSFISPYRDYFSDLLKNHETHFFIEDSPSKTKVEWHLHVGDYYELLEKSPRPDLIYYDFYTPRSIPELWTEEKFKTLRDFIGDQKTELYTYSAATPVRLALLLAGFFVGQGHRTKLKTETTVAATEFSSLENPLGEKWLSKLSVSTSIPSDELRSRGKNHPQWSLLQNHLLKD